MSAILNQNYNRSKYKTILHLAKTGNQVKNYFDMDMYSLVIYNNLWIEISPSIHFQKFLAIHLRLIYATNIQVFEVVLKKSFCLLTTNSKGQKNNPA